MNNNLNVQKSKQHAHAHAHAHQGRMAQSGLHQEGGSQHTLPLVAHQTQWRLPFASQAPPFASARNPKTSTNKQAKKKKNTKAMCACACMCVMCVCVSCVHACVFQATCWTSGNLRRSVQVKNFIIVARFLALVSECHKVDTYADKCTLLTDTTDKSIMRIHPSLI